MNPIVRFCQRMAAPILTSLMLVTPATSAYAIVVKIDPSRSSVTYTPGGVVLCDPQGNCGSLPDTQTFALSGTFNITQETVSYPVWFDPSVVFEREEIQFDTLAIDSGGAAALGFSFPTYRGVLDGLTFAASNDGCSFFPSIGSCSSFGPFANYSGMFDGTMLSMTGSDYTGNFFPDQFSFTVIARAADPASVPEPGTLACVAAAVFSLGATGRRRRKASAELCRNPPRFSAGEGR